MPGALKMAGGALLAFLALQHEIPVERAIEPTQMYLTGFEYAVGPGTAAVLLTGIFVIVSQIKINVTNAYAGSLAWSNFFARLTHSHPGRVVWLGFNVLIAVMLMAMGVFEALEKVLGLYAHLAVAWVGALVADLVISKPLGLSPQRIEFRRAYLFDINPSGFGAMLLGSSLSIAAYAGLFGDALQAASTAIALGVPLLAAPLIALATGGRWSIARTPTDFGARHRSLRCVVCRNRFEADDMAGCPAYDGAICSLCCTLEARCGDRCKPDTQASERLARLLTRWLPAGATPAMLRRIGQFALVLGGMVTVFSAILWLLYAQERLHLEADAALRVGDLGAMFVKVFAGLLLLAAVAAWWLVLVNESRRVAQQESDRQNLLLQREIDAHRRTDALLQRAKELAESANLAKSRFLTGMSHEMRAPLNSILGYSQLLLRDKTVASGARESIDTIHRSGQHLASLVDGLLELSRIEAGKLRIEQQPLDLNDFFAQIVRMFEPLARDNGLSFRYELAGTLPARVNADPKRLRQILINLLGNAIKFTERGGVSLRVRYQREIAHIEVADTGVGIADADQPRVFQPFERLSNRPGVEGMGLGLTITRLLVDLMGGDIRLWSRPGEGSRFTVRVYLPMLPSVSLAPPEREIIGYAGARRELLVVDDDLDHRALMRARLEPLGFAISQAGNGTACLAALARQRPDLVLLDIGLPDMSGWEVCERLHEQGATAAQRPPAIIIVSANVHENNEAQRARFSVHGFIAKPVSERDLFDAIQQALRLQWRRAAPEAASAALAEQAQTSPVSPDVARELLALSAGGYPRALRARLDELGEESVAAATWVARLIPLLETDRDRLHAALNDILHERTRA